MLSVPGKAPFHDLYSAARKFIWHRYHTWVEQTASDPKGQPQENRADDDKAWSNFRQEPFDTATTDLDLLNLNIQSAAKLACLNLVVSKGGSVEILTPYGTTVRIPVVVFGRPVSVRGMQSLDRSISPCTFLGSRWQRVFLTQPVFETLFTHGILDWRLGTVDTDPLDGLLPVLWTAG